MAEGSDTPGRGAIERRKDDHLELCASEDVEAAAKTTLLEDVELVHDAVPDRALDEVDIAVDWLGKTLRAPLLITGMTGGTAAAAEVNGDLARVAESMGIAFGLGSQRAMQKAPESAWTFDVRREAPTTVVLGNIGLGQAREMDLADFQALVAAVGADGLCVHLNVAQELIQPEGDRDFRGGTQAFERIAGRLGVPVVAKETGCGISRAVASRLRDAGVRHLDVSGAGGTSWVQIEALRSAGSASRLGELFRDWGVPTAACLLQTAGLGLTVVASGGIRNGLEVAKAIALGARVVGVALPVFQAYRAGGSAGALAFLDELIAGLKIAMVLTGSATLDDLRSAPRVLGPRLEAWRPGSETGTNGAGTR